MKPKHIFKSKVFWGVGSKFLNIAGGFILLPVVVHYLDKEALALFYLFVSLTMITGILDFGFNSTLTRNFAYAYAGARDIHAEGVCSEFNKETNWKLVGELYLLSKKIYLYLSLVTLIVFFVPGSYYIYSVVNKSNLTTNYAISCWLIYSLSSVLAMYFVYLSAMLQGRGDVNLVNQISVFSKCSNIIISVIMLISGCGLLSISISAISVCIIERILYFKFAFKDKNHQKIKSLRINDQSNLKKNLKLISVNSIKFGIVSLGAYLITRSTIILATTYLGLLDSASYIFTIQIITIIMGVSSTIIGVYLPKLNQLSQHPKEQFDLFCFTNLISLLFYLFSSLILLLLGRYCLTLLHSNTSLINTWQLAVLLFIYLLEVQHSNYAAMITTSNKVPFVGAAIYSGIAIVVLSILLLHFTKLGIWGLIISQGVVQAIYNNWYWIRYVCAQYHVSYPRTLLLGVKYAKNR